MFTVFVGGYGNNLVLGEITLNAVIAHGVKLGYRKPDREACTKDYVRYIQFVELKIDKYAQSAEGYMQMTDSCSEVTLSVEQFLSLKWKEKTTEKCIDSQGILVCMEKRGPNEHRVISDALQDKAVYLGYRWPGNSSGKFIKRAPRYTAFLFCNNGDIEGYEDAAQLPSYDFALFSEEDFLNLDSRLAVKNVTACLKDTIPYKTDRKALFDFLAISNKGYKRRIDDGDIGWVNIDKDHRLIYSSDAPEEHFVQLSAASLQSGDY
jgi:hypothetical protein